MDEIARRDGYHRFEWLHQSVGKEEIPCDVTLTPVQYQNGNALLVVWQDLRERKMAEAELLDREERLRQANISMVATQQQMRNYTEELEYANQELEEFAYIASHDLRSPLRGIGQLSRFIREDDAPNLSEESQQNLDRLEGRVDRMQKLLDDLLCYSRIGQSDPELEEIDVGFLISETIELLSVAPHFEIAVQEPLPALVSYPTPLRMVFLNLIGNAVKHHNGPTGSISVGCKALESCYQFTVADDGPGIDSAYHTKIFKMFQTLESRDKVEASGMGLAIIQKTLLRFGGEITVESELGSGSSFHFTWPKTHEQHR